MSDDQHCFIQMALPDVGHERGHAGAGLPDTFPAGGCEVQVFDQRSGELLRIALPALFGGQAFKDPFVVLPQPLRKMQRHVTLTQYVPDGPGAAAQVAAIGHVYGDPGQPPAHQARLLVALFRECHVGMALDPPFGVPFRFAMSNDQQSTHSAERPPLTFDQNCPPLKGFPGTLPGPDR